MRPVSKETIIRLRELLTLLTQEKVSIEQILLRTSIPTASIARKMIVKLKQEHSIEVEATYLRKNTASSSTRYCLYTIEEKHRKKALELTDPELGKSVVTDGLPDKIKELAKAGYDIDFICGKLDKTRSCILYHAEKGGINLKVKRNKKLATRPPTTSNDLLTIYMPRPKSLI